MPSVSIIVPTHNCVEYLGQAVRSVMHQTYSDLEVIVIDDGSNDATEDLMKELSGEDDRIRYVKCKHSKGAAAARNLGLHQASGEFISFLDCDDIYDPKKLECLIDVLKNHPNIGVVFCNLALFKDSTNNICGYYPNAEDFIRNAALYLESVDDTLYFCNKYFYNYMSVHETAISTLSIIFRKSLLDDFSIYFPENYVIGEDIDFWFRLVRKTDVAYINKILAFYRVRQGSITSNKELALSGFIQVHERNLLRGTDVFSMSEITQYKKRIARNWNDLAYYYFNRYETKKSRNAYLSSLKLSFEWRTLIGLLKSIVPRVFLVKLVPLWRNLR